MFLHSGIIKLRIKTKVKLIWGQIQVHTSPNPELKWPKPDDASLLQCKLFSHVFVYF